MTATDQTPLESAIAPHLLRADRAPKHRPGTYTPPYPSFSARFGEQIRAVVMAYYGLQVRDERDPALAEALAEALGEQRIAFGADDGPASWDRASYVDAEGYRTVIGIGYWDDPATFDRWHAEHGKRWIDPHRVRDGLGFFLELVTPSVERFETIHSSVEQREGISAMASGMSGMVEEHFYWGSARDRFAVSQHNPLWAEGEPRLTVDGAVRTVVLHENACLIRSGQDITDTGEQERAFYLTEVEPVLQQGMDFIRDEGAAIGCFDNRYMTVLDEYDRPTDRTFGMSWWRDLSSLEEWAASHPSHLKIYGAGMRHLSGFGPETRLRLYHEVTVPAAKEQRFVYVGCHDRTGMLRSLV